MCLLWASSLQTLGAVISRHPVTWVRLSRYDRGWTADALLGELAIFLQVFDGVEVRASIHNVDFLRLHLQAPDLFSLEDYLCRRMAFCQLGLAPRAVVSTLKTEGQRGDIRDTVQPDRLTQGAQVVRCKSGLSVGGASSFRNGSSQDLPLHFHCPLIESLLRPNQQRCDVNSKVTERAGPWKKPREEITAIMISARVYAQQGCSRSSGHERVAI
uniref:uncharacterized protein LOC124049557 isoform X2 n=1 Tax=Scatophagus argus TaxID=75038 RepID=UPI001ED810D6|nr:uncharacterized protein LOC124049557 isoform X2 [Scatophagus argus]